jgi:hypothetical protein
MQNTTETLTWLTEAHLECVRKYRCALEREINHVQRIYNHKLSEEVKRVLKQSLKEIEIPTYPQPPCRELAAQIWGKVRKPNWELIRREYLEMIDTL